MMKKTSIWFAAVCLLMLGNAWAQQNQDGSTREPPPAVWKNPRNFEMTQKAWELVTDEEYVEAEAEFRDLVGRFKDDYERSQAMFGLAQSLMLQDDFDEALSLYEQIVNLDVLQNKPHFDAMFQIAQLYYMRERYDDSLRWIDRWLRESGETKVEAYELKASIYAQKEDYRKALENIDIAIATTEKPPKETWYQLKLAMHFELNEFQEAKEVLETLVRGWPDKKTYWIQLASINVTLKNDKEALAILALAHRQGMLESQQDFMQLFSLYGYLEIPFEAAKILQEGIDAGIVEPDKRIWEQLGNAWYASQELDNSIAALKNAADESDNGKLDMQVAMILVDKESWEEAKQSLRNAIEKGGLSQTELGNMYVLLGMSELNTGSYTEARQAFREARTFEGSRSSATQWLNHLDELAKNESPGP